MDVQIVFEKLAEILCKDPQEIPELVTLCQEATDEIKNSICPGEDTKKNQNRLCAAAASLAFYRYSLSRVLTSEESADNLASVAETYQAATSVKISEKAKVLASLAEKMWQSSELGIKDLLKDTNFSFRSVNKFGL